MNELFLRNEMLWGREAQERLAQAHVILFGLGGVGSYTAECLARSGIGQLTIVDNDVVSPSNRNRQLEALGSTVGQEKTAAVAARLWDSLADSLRCTPQGRCYATPEGLAQNITVTSLDIGQVLQAIKTTAPRLLEQQVARAEDMSEVYADDNTYRQDFLLDVMLSAANAALTEAPVRECSLTVHLQYRDRQWWVLPEQTLLEAVSGGILE